MFILFLILFSCHTQAMNNDASTQDLHEWIESLRPAPLDQNTTTDTSSLAPTTPVHPPKRSTQSISDKNSTRKKKRLEKLLLQKVRCPLYAEGCSWACVHAKPTTPITQRIIKADCVQQLREHWMQTHFSVEAVTRYVGNEMERASKVNLDACDADSLDTLTRTFIGTHELQ